MKNNIYKEELQNMNQKQRGNRKGCIYILYIFSHHFAYAFKLNSFH